jgi:hypothetical protein
MRVCKKNLDEVVLAWGYVVRDIQITDMTFDKEIIDSMARVVSSKNLLAAASTEGAAPLIKRTINSELPGCGSFELQHGTVRTNIRRYTRLSNGFIPQAREPCGNRGPQLPCLQTSSGFTGRFA